MYEGRLHSGVMLVTVGLLARKPHALAPPRRRIAPGWAQRERGGGGERGEERERARERERETERETEEREREREREREEG
eukprot:2487759-Rhodomonas_salina.1